jgi:hypothetical protein
VEVALILVALIYNEIDKPEPLSPLLVAHFSSMDDCVAAAKGAQGPGWAVSARSVPISPVRLHSRQNTETVKVMLG